MSPDQHARALRLADRLYKLRSDENIDAAVALLRELAAEPVRQWLGPYTDAWTALNELRRAVAEVIGADPDVWPTHGNAPLAIAASVATRQMELKKRDAASAGPMRVPLTDELAVSPQEVTEALRFVRTHLYAAQAQASPGDDSIIMRHVYDAYRRIADLTKEVELHGITGDAK